MNHNKVARIVLDIRSLYERMCGRPLLTWLQKKVFLVSPSASGGQFEPMGLVNGFHKNFPIFFKIMS